MSLPATLLIDAVGVLLEPTLPHAPRRGAVSLVVDARRRGLRVVVVTDRPEVEAALAAGTLAGLADEVRTADHLEVDPALGPVVLVLAGPQTPVSAPTEVTVVRLGERTTPQGAVIAGVGDVDLDVLVPATFERLGSGPLLQDGWVVIDDHHDPASVADVATRHLTGNGYLGYRGTLPEWDASATVGCTVSDTYDNADGKWAELCNVPNALHARWEVLGATLAVAADEPPSDRDRLERRLDVRYVRQHRILAPAVGPVRRLVDERFASMAQRHLVAQRQRVLAEPGTRLICTTGIDGQVWSLNGDHFRSAVPVDEGDVLAVDLRTTERDLPITVAHAIDLHGGEVLTTHTSAVGRSIHRTLEIEVGPSGVVELHQVMTVHSGNDVADPATASRDLARSAVVAGYEATLADHVRAWDRLWDRIDVVIDGDPVAQTVLRFNLAHNVIATPMHTDHLPVGARGLSCQAYQGAAFWDQEVFNLPMWVHTFPEVARALLTYRHRTLDGARRKAARLGYRGAYYAWISGDTGDELCPDFFFVDVLTGRPIRNHFNVWQMHISPDVAATIDGYVRATGDEGFRRDAGAEILVEVARFLASFVLFRPADDAYHLVRLLGPDEFHENVDDNVFSLEQSRVALAAAIEVVDRLAAHDPERLAQLRERLDLHDDEVATWRDIHDRLRVVEPDPDTLVLEQFDGYLQLEDTTPAVVRSRLQHPDEYWGWPNGVAVHTQVTKQADVVQLFVNQPERYDRDVVEANYRYYLPRTAHSSSLSRPMYALVAARLGHLEEARQLFLDSASVDLLATSHAAPGGTFIGGIHTAACGAAWQVAVLGFGGVHVRDDHVEVSPRLPRGWDRLGFSLTVRGQRLDVDAATDHVTLSAPSTNEQDIAVRVHGHAPVLLAPGTRRDEPC